MNVDICQATQTIKRLKSIIRRAHTFGHSHSDTLFELDCMVADLQKQIELTEQEMQDAA